MLRSIMSSFAAGKHAHKPGGSIPAEILLSHAIGILFFA